MSLQYRIVSKKTRSVLEKDVISVVAIMNNIASSRKIARRILPEIKKELGFEPKLETVAKVIERYVKIVEKSGKLSGYDIDEIRRIFSKSRIMIQSDIGLVGLRITKNIGNKLVKVMQYVYSRKEKPFINISFGHTYITVVIDQHNIEKVIKIVGRKNMVYIKKNQAALSVISPPDVISIPGLSGYIFSVLGLSGINVVEIISSYNEGIIILNESDANKAYTVLREEIERFRSQSKD